MKYTSDQLHSMIKNKNTKGVVDYALNLQREVRRLSIACEKSKAELAAMMGAK